MEYKAYADKILVKELKAEKPEGALIIVPDTFLRGEVDVAGDEKINPGEIVFYKKDAASPITLDGIDYKIISQRDAWLGRV